LFTVLPCTTGQCDGIPIGIRKTDDLSNLVGYPSLHVVGKFLVLRTLNVLALVTASVENQHEQANKNQNQVSTFFHITHFMVETPYLISLLPS
jgi:hypothetical protein